MAEFLPIPMNTLNVPEKNVAFRIARFLLLLIASWVVMTFTHEMGHIVAGACCGGKLTAANLLPWQLPYSIFDPDPFPLITLWGGLVLGAVVPVVLATCIQRDWSWFIANFCVLANGVYILTGWLFGDRYLDTPRLLEHGASPIALGIYCLVTIGFGYVGFRRSCIATFKGVSVVHSGSKSRSDGST